MLTKNVKRDQTYVEKHQECQFHRINKSNAKIFPWPGDCGNQLPQEFIHELITLL